MVNDFLIDKKVALKTLSEFDRSDKGSLDEPIKLLIKTINEFSDHYTTSSCSGRIILIEVPESNKKKDFKFLFRAHRLVKSDEVWNVIKEYSGKNTVWLRQEPVILHVGTKTLESADKFLRIAKSIGLKRSGLFEFKKRLIMELVGTEHVEVPIIIKGEKVVDEPFLKLLIDEVNVKLERNFDKIDLFNSLLKNY